ncbi:hypothetical protein [Streptomyces echinatus]|uniref:hypothetical protein n=1 Tax=Streptomyces echinatus TaxID=67293 RepID=UPI00378E9B9D
MKTRPGSPGEASGPPAAGLPPPAERGATVIPDRVVARIARQAARTAQARRAAVPPDRGGPTAPSASAAVGTGSVRLHLALDLPYPWRARRPGPRGGSLDPPPAAVGGGDEPPYREEDLSHPQAGQLGHPFGDVLLDPLTGVGDVGGKDGPPR